MDTPAATPNDVAPPTPLSVLTLVELASRAVAAAVDVEDIAAHLDFVPFHVSETVLHHLTDTRLRRLERLLASDGAFETHDSACQAEWRRRCHALGLRVDAAISTDTLFRDMATSVPRDPRRAYWEHTFRSVLRAEPPSIVTPTGSFVEATPQPDVELYDDVVEALTVHARELVPRNIVFMLQLHRLERIELHHPTEHHKDAVAHGLETLLGQTQRLKELGFYHGRLSSTLLERLATAIERRVKSDFQPLHSIELVSVKLKGPAEHRALVQFFQRTQHFERVRISCVLADFENRRLVDQLLKLPTLAHLSLEHNDLEDDAFMGFLHAQSQLKQLRLSNNNISSTTLQTLATATLDGRVALERLDVRNNPHISDPGVHALAPMLSPYVSTLTHLDVRSCHFGLEGALTLLSALGENKTLLSLDLSQNFFGSSVGDLLADFLLTNDTLERLHINYVGLGLAGCTERLQLALRTNTALCVLSVGANRLRDTGAVLVMEAIAARSRVKPYEALDLCGNLITVDGLHDLYRVLGPQPVEGEDDQERFNKRPRKQSFPDDSNPLIQELGLLNNDLLGSGDTSTRVRLALEALRHFVGKIYSNEWTSRRQVYDDEV